MIGLMTYIFIAIVLVIWYRRKTNSEESFADSLTSSIKYKRCDTLALPNVEQNIVRSFTKTTNDDFDVYYPCGYTYAEKELEENNQFKHRLRGWVMVIKGVDNLVAKDRLWKCLQERYGRLESQVFSPETWITYDPK